jgi:hypothetical protein
MMLLVFSTGCGTVPSIPFSHVMLQTNETGTGSLYTCTQTDNQYICAPAKDEGQANETLSGTLYVNLPKECSGRFRQILLHNVSSGPPQVLVKCGTFENQHGTTP